MQLNKKHAIPTHTHIYIYIYLHVTVQTDKYTSRLLMWVLSYTLKIQHQSLIKDMTSPYFKKKQNIIVIVCKYIWQAYTAIGVI